MDEITLTLPEWTFLDSTSHLGNLLENRDVLLHIPSFTIMEILSMDDNEFLLNPQIKKRKFTYINILGIEEEYLIVVHVCLESDFELTDILDKTVEFYKKYLEWDDNNAITENISKHN